MRIFISKKLQAKIYIRDNWCCRYCGIAVFFSPALKSLEELNPNHGYYHKNGRKDRMSSSLLDQCGAIDHIKPVSEGGMNEIPNLVCSCWKCNTMKSNEDSEKWVNKIIPIEELNVPNGWDGFLGILEHLDSENEWIPYFRK